MNTILPAMNNQRELAKLRTAIGLYFGVPTEPKWDNLSGDHAGNVMKEMGELGIMICGGAITSLFSGDTIKDLDLYCEHEWQQRGAQEWIERRFSNLAPFVSVNANTYKRKSATSNKVYTVQLIKRFSGDPATIFGWFDFTVTTGCFRLSDQTFHFGDRFLQDVANRRLVFQGRSTYPICAMYRTKKYQAKGFTLPGSTIMHICLAVVRLKIDNYGDLKEQLMGIDTSYLQGFLKGPEYADDLPVDYGKFLEDAFASLDGFRASDSEEDGDDFPG